VHCFPIEFLLNADALSGQKRQRRAVFHSQSKEPDFRR